MQSIKRSLTVALFLSGTGLVHAAPTPALMPAPTSDESAMQQHLQKMVEADYAWETKKRELSNELELEKMKSEIRKLRGEDKVRPVPVSDLTPPDASSRAPSGGFPHILLESNIGGLLRVAVGSANENDLLYVAPGDNFTLDGRQYQLVRDKRSGLAIKETGR
ncbi:hypothetical protein [Pseudescherichia sp.]|uniref:hypothetical protein n=1 Tax=Pseudescherichia sp. TaxID=2055881 RepID=UPI0028A59669|nr:hypothetical protein [Pseudescherichia sp.]